MAATYEELMLKARDLKASGDIEAAKRVAQIALTRRGQPQTPKPDVAPETNMVEQSMSGLNEGMASLAGFPVDALTGLINAGKSGVNAIAGTDFQPIKNPVGGSGSFESLMGGAISDTAPQTRAQRYGRRVGQEVGFGAPLAMATGPLASGLRGGMKSYMGTSVAGDVGAGLAGQTSREIAPENDTMDLIASLLGGTATAGAIASRKIKPDPAPTREAIQQQTDDLYELVEGSGADLTPAAQSQFTGDLNARFAAEGGDQFAYPKASAQLKAIENTPRQSIHGVEQARRRLRDKVARSPDESAIGADLVDEVEDYLNSLQPSAIASNSVDPQEVIDTLRKARKSAHTGIKADEVTDALNSANSRTSTTGTAGNSLNAQSQEVRKIYDKEVSLRNKQKSGGYTPDEVQAMKEIVFPTKGERLAQRIGRLAPSTGGLQTAMTTAAGGGGLASTIATGNPVWMLGALPSGAGMIAQGVAERAKGKKIDALMDVLLRGGKKSLPKSNDAARAAVVTQLLSGAQ